MSPANLLHLPPDLQPSKQGQTITSTAAEARGPEWTLKASSVPFTHAKAGYRHAIFKQETPGSRECRGFLSSCVATAMRKTR